MDEYEDSGSSGGLFGRYREEGFDFNGSTRGGKEYARDVCWLGQSDKGVRELVKALNWEKELDDLYHTSRKELEKQDLSTRDTPTSTPQKKKGEAASPSSPKLSDAREEVKKVSQQIGEEVDKPADKQQVGAVRKEDEQAFDTLAKEIDKLGLAEKKDDSPVSSPQKDREYPKASL